MQNPTNKLIIQNHNHTPNLIEAYGNLYFYFRSKAIFRNYILDVGSSLNIGNNFDTILKHLRKMLSQKISVSKREFPLSNRFQRIRGTHVQFLNKILGIKLDTLEGKISRLTKHSGRGGIRNPKFPSGEILAVALSRLAATTLADGHLKPNGTIEFFEPELDRIRLIEKNLRVFGDIRANPKLVKRDNVYVCYFPSPLGIALQYYGLSSGNKSILNPRLPQFITNGSTETRCAFFEDFVPQDGTVSVSKPMKFTWTQSSTLHPGVNGTRYPNAPRLYSVLVDFVKKHGKQEKNCSVLSSKRLHRLASRSQLAGELKKQIDSCKNNLIEDSVLIAQRLGVNVESKPYTVRYFKKTGKVTIAWVARTLTIDDTIRLGVVAPPNDVKKRAILKQLIMNRSELVTKVMDGLRNDNIDFDEWWK